MERADDGAQHPSSDTSEADTLTARDGDRVDSPPRDISDNYDDPSKYKQTKLDSDILQPGSERLADRFSIYEDGTISINNEYSLNIYTKMMLYVVAAKFAHEERYRDTPRVSGDELKAKFTFRTGEVGLFLEEASKFLTQRHRLDSSEYFAMDETEFEVGVKQLPKAIDWILSEEHRSGMFTDIDYQYSYMCINAARESCSEVEKFEGLDGHNRPEKALKNMKYELTEAIKGVSNYPVEVNNNADWKAFMRATDAAIGYIENGDNNSVLHCMKRMKQYLKGMEAAAE